MKQAKAEEEAPDRISRLPDELIHHILSFNSTKLAVQTSVLSKRWYNVWTTLPHLNLTTSHFANSAQFSLFLTRLFANRNHHSDISTVNLYSIHHISLDLLKTIISYVISHNAKTLSIDTTVAGRGTIPLSVFSSMYLEKLAILRVFPKVKADVGLCWSLPGLTELDVSGCSLPDSFLELPALRTLSLERCELPKSFKGLPVLRRLCLKYVCVPENNGVYFSEIGELENLSLVHCKVVGGVMSLSSDRLSKMSVRSSVEGYKFVISAPKLVGFEHSGSLTEYVFPLTSSGLCQVKLEMDSWYLYKWERFEVAVVLIDLLQELQKAKFLIVNWNVIEVIV